MEGSDAPLVGLVDPPRYPPRPRGDTSGRDPRIVLWGRVGAPLALAILTRWPRPVRDAPPRETRDWDFYEFSSRQLGDPLNQSKAVKVRS